MILQPKSTNNLPETLATSEANPGEAIVSAGLNMIPGSENAATVPVNNTKQLNNQEGDKKKENDAAATTPRQHQQQKKTTPMKDDNKPVLG